MRLSIITGLLFAVCSAVAQDIDLGTLLGQMGGDINPSEACTAESAKYKDCVNGKLAYLSKENKEEIQGFCSSFDETKCKDFFADINKSESACVSGNLGDFFTGIEGIFSKLYYQLFCAKDSNGKICPFSQYLLDNIEKLNSKEDDKTTDMTAEELKIVADDCRDSKCQERMIALKESLDNLEKSMSSSLGDDASSLMSEGSLLSDNSTSVLFDKFYPSYKDKKCGLIDNSKDDGPKSSNDSSDASTLKKITFAFVTMMTLSAVMLF